MRWWVMDLRITCFSSNMWLSVRPFFFKIICFILGHIFSSDETENFCTLCVVSVAVIDRFILIASYHIYISQCYISLDRNVSTQVVCLDLYQREGFSAVTTDCPTKTTKKWCFSTGHDDNLIQIISTTKIQIN
jgi:hypothetical protein